MITPCAPVILASASPRRRQLLQQIGINASWQSADINEAAKEAEPAQDYVSRLAEGKAQAIYTEDKHHSIIIAADTIVALDNRLLGKPADFAQAKAYWQLLSGQSHQVYTAMAILYQGRCFPSLSINQVHFSHISDAQMQAYWQTGEPQDKAGAYAIQGMAAAWVERIEGSYSAIMGLDLAQLAQTLQTLSELHHE